MSASSDYLNVLTSITREGGATRAATARANSAIWGNTVSKLGDFASDAIKQYGIDKKAKKQEDEDQAFKDLFSRASQEFQAQQQPSMAELTGGTPTPDTYTPGGLQGSFAGNVPQSHVTPGAPAASAFTGPELKGARQPRLSPFPTPSEILSVYPPQKAIPVINAIAALHKLDPNANDTLKLEQLQTIYKGLDKIPEDQRAAYFPGLIEGLEQVKYLPPGQVSKEYNPATWATIGNSLKVTPDKAGTRVMKTVKDGVAGEEIVPDTPGQFFPSPPEKEPTSKGLQSEAFLLDGKPVKGTFDPNTGKYMYQGNDVSDRAKPIPPAGLTISPTMQAEQSNAKETALGIKDGTISPEVLLSTRSTAQGMALNAELHKLGVNTDKIVREWSGTKRAIASLNSNQQVRLAQAIGKASASLDKVEELNKQWGQIATRFGLKVANRAELKAAQNGAYGPEAASVAQRLDGQIADVTSEIGQVVMGGNSPTDHGLDLAGKNLSSDWTQKVLTDSIGQVRYNLNLADKARNEMLGQLGVTSTQFQPPPPANTAPPAAPKANPFR